MTAFSDWLHKLPADKLVALRAFRRASREAYPEDSNPLERALNDGNASALILAMPREFVLALDH